MCVWFHLIAELSAAVVRIAFFLVSVVFLVSLVVGLEWRSCGGEQHDYDCVQDFPLQGHE
jgi:hypothetical protein